MTRGIYAPSRPDEQASLKDEFRLLNEVAQSIPRDNPNRVLLGVAERLNVWSELAREIDPASLDAAGQNPGASRYGYIGTAIVAADNAGRAQQYLDAIALAGPDGAPAGHSCEPQTVRSIHDILHRAGLCTTRQDGAAVTFDPGQWRGWERAIEDPRTGQPIYGAPPAEIPAAMARWAEDHRPDRWSGHPAGRAASAYAGLIAIQPFADGNGRVARTVAHGILREGGYPATGLSAMMERYRPRMNARLADAVTSGQTRDWTRAFTALATEGLDAMNRARPDIKEGVIQLAARLDRDAGPDHKARHKMALVMMTLPVDRPHSFAQRNGLDQEPARQMLKPLVRAGQLEAHRINGQQVLLNPPSLQIARDMARPDPSRLQDLTAQKLRGRQGDAR